MLSINLFLSFFFSLFSFQSLLRQGKEKTGLRWKSGKLFLEKYFSQETNKENYFLCFLFFVTELWFLEISLERSFWTTLFELCKCEKGLRQTVSVEVRAFLECQNHAYRSWSSNYEQSSLFFFSPNFLFIYFFKVFVLFEVIVTLSRRFWIPKWFFFFELRFVYERLMNFHNFF